MAKHTPLLLVGSIRPASGSGFYTSHIVGEVGVDMGIPFQASYTLLSKQTATSPSEPI